MNFVKIFEFTLLTIAVSTVSVEQSITMTCVIIDILNTGCMLTAIVQFTRCTFVDHWNKCCKNVRKYVMTPLLKYIFEDLMKRYPVVLQFLILINRGRGVEI